MCKLFDKIKAKFSFKSGNKAVAKNGSNATAGDNSPITHNTYNANYIELLEEKLEDVRKTGELETKAFNRLEQLYEFAKAQHPKHPSIETFGVIAVAYYTQKINDAKEKGENTLAYERALARYYTV